MAFKVSSIGSKKFIWFNDISTFVIYLMLKPSFKKNNSGTILEFELVDYEIEVQHFSYHAKRTISPTHK